MSHLILLDYETPKAHRRPRASAGGPAAVGRRGEPGGEGLGCARPQLRIVPCPAAGDGAGGVCADDEGGAACDTRREACAAGAAPGSTCRGAGRLVLLRGQKTLVVW